jgi:hypothetical protein
MRSPIFIGGAGRSGTSLLRTILNAHSQIAIGAELKVTPLIAKFWNQLSNDQPYLEQQFAVTQADIDSALKNLVTTLLNNYRLQTGKSRIGEKTPNNVFVFRQLHQIFPNSPLIHIIRDGRDVVRSLLQQNWQSGSDGKPMAITQEPAAAAAYWKQAVLAGRKAALQSPTLRKRYTEIRYEQLVTSPEKTIRPLFEHIGESWEPDVLHFHEQDNPDVYDQVYRPISDSSVGKWKRGLSRDEKNAVKEVAGDLLIDLGYATDLNW